MVLHCDLLQQPNFATTEARVLASVRALARHVRHFRLQRCTMLLQELGWFIGEGEPMCEGGEHETFARLSNEQSRAVAIALDQALDDATLPASESDTTGAHRTRPNALTQGMKQKNLTHQMHRHFAVRESEWLAC